jgi:lysophospholipase L1-like esterase
MRRARLAATVLAALATWVGTAMAIPHAADQGRVPTHVFRVWPLGDSITNGTLEPNKGVGGGYRGFLDADLQAAGISHQFVGSMSTNPLPTLQARGQQRHEGHPGFRVADIAAGINGPVVARGYHGGWWLRHVDPDLVLIHLGTNDMVRPLARQLGIKTAYTSPALTAKERGPFIARLTGSLLALVEQVHSQRPRAIVVLATVTPLGHDVCDVLSPLYADAVRHLVLRERAAGMRIVLADIWSAFTARTNGKCTLVPDLMADDGVHPTSRGYAVMAHVFELAIAQVAG